MNPQELQALREKRGKYHNDAVAAKTKAQKAMNEKDDTVDRSEFSSAMEEFDKLHAVAVECDRLIRAEEGIAEFEAQWKNAETDPEEPNANSETVDPKLNELHEKSFLAYLNGGIAAAKEAGGEEGLKLLRLGVHGDDRWMEDGQDVSDSPPEHRAATNRAGNMVLIPEVIHSDILRTRRAYGGLTPGMRVIRTRHGRKYSLPFFDRRGRVQANFRAIGEGEVIGAAADIVTSRKSFGAFKKSSGILKLGSEVIIDTVNDFREMAGSELAEDLSRNVASSYANADGKKAPGADPGTDAHGLIYRMREGGGNISQRYLSRIDDGKKRSFYMNWRDVYGLKNAVDQAYADDPSARYFFGTKAWEAIAFLTDDNYRPLWVQSTRVGEPDRYAGKPYSVGFDIALNLPAAADKNEFVIGFGAMRRFAIRYAGGVRFRYTDQRYWETDEIGLNLLMRMDHDMLDDNAFASIIASTTAADAEGAPHKTGNNPRETDEATMKGVLIGSVTLP